MYKFSITMKFKDIYNDVVTFKNDYETLLRSNSDENDNILFNYLYLYYCNSNIRYDTIDAFKRHFLLDYDNYKQEYIKRMKTTERIYNLTESDLTLIEQGINNFANNDNKLVDDPFNEIIKFITSQGTHKTNSNTFIALDNYLSSLKNKQIKDFVNNFKSHFISVIL